MDEKKPQLNAEALTLQSLYADSLSLREPEPTLRLAQCNSSG